MQGRAAYGVWSAVRAVARCAPAAIAALLLAGARPAAAQSVAFVSSSFNSGSMQAAWSHTVPAGGQDRYLLVGVSVRHTMRAAVVMEARFVDGLNVTQQLGFLGAATLAGQARVEFWGLPGPNVGQGVITVRLDGTGGLVAGALSFTGVHQSSSTGAMVSNMGTGQTASLVVPSATDEAIVSVYSGNGVVLPVPRAPHVARWSFQGLLLGAGGTEPGRAGATVVWDTPGGNQPWVLGGMRLRPVQAAPPPPPPPPPPDAGPDLPPDMMMLPPDTAAPPIDMGPPPVDMAPPPPDTAPPVDTAPPPPDVTAPADTTPGGVDMAPGVPDGSGGTGGTGGGGGGGGGDTGVPADRPGSTDGGGSDVQGSGAGSDGAVSVRTGAYSIGCACHLGPNPGHDRSGGLPLWLLAAVLAAVSRRRR